MTNSVPKLKTHFKKDALRCIELLRKSIDNHAISDETKNVLGQFLQGKYGDLEDKVKVIITSTYVTFLGKINFADKDDPKNAEIKKKLLKDLDMVKKAVAPNRM